MSKLSLKQRILRHLTIHSDWINGGELERLAMSVGYKGSTAGSLCRKMERDGLIVKDLRQGKTVASIWYKII